MKTTLGMLCLLLLCPPATPAAIVQTTPAPRAPAQTTQGPTPQGMVQSTLLTTAHGEDSHGTEHPTADPSHDFTYDEDDPHGPVHWGELCEHVGKQSPVDIPFENLSYDPGLRSLLFKNYAINSSSLSLVETNNGHTTVIMLDGSPALSILGGGLKHEYFLRQFHFHWGPDDSQGSEHTFDRHRYPLEMHLVHQAKDANLPEQEKLAVIGVLFELSDQNNTHLTTIVNNLRKVIHYGESVELDHFAIADVLPDRRDRYFRYEGSLTTPPCSEQVIWTVMFDTVPISHDQVEEFRHELDSHEMLLRRNNRPVQKLGDRVITASFMPVVTFSEVTGGTRTETPLATLLLAAALVSRLV